MAKSALVKSHSPGVIKPRQCVIGFGIPTNRESFEKHKAEPARRDFVMHCCPNWAEYYHFVVQHIDIVLPRLRSLGVEVSEELTLRGFGQFLAKPETGALVVFSHFTKSEIEFADGLASAKEIIEQVPPAFDGVLDLCVCHPTELIIALEGERPRCLKKFVDLQVRPSIWLHFYRILFETLRASDIGYLEAAEDSIQSFLKG